MSLADYCLIALIAVCVIAALVRMHKKKKSGNLCCGSCSGGCPGCGSCHSKP